MGLGNKGSTRVISSYLTRYFEESGNAQQVERRERADWSEAQNLQADVFLGQLRDLAFSHAREAFDVERVALREQQAELLERVQAAEDAAAEFGENKEKLEATIQQQAELITDQRDARIKVED